MRELRKLKEVNLSMQLNHSSKLDLISNAIQKITYQSSVIKESPSSEENVTSLRHLTDKLLDLTENAQKVSLQQRIIRGLYFRSMRVRHHSIAEAHAETFSWVLRRNETPGSTALDHDSNFARWLELGKGIYWVSGKAGSGKSTLMKFLSDHPRTAELLNTWSQPRECIIASHYFWSSGTRLQKTLDGLLRSLLFEIFRQIPDLIAKIVPNDLALNDDDASFAAGDEGRPWSMFELSQVVNRLVGLDEMPVRFCFFIDGLDEYGGDHREVVKILSRLAASSIVKLCVSSRPWNVFEDAYGIRNSWKLSLQDLTQDDIRCYTESMLLEHPNWAEYSAAGDSLVREISDKAQGVFLWVFLVVRSLDEGVTNGDAISTLRRRIRQLPQDLEAFFKHMLDSIDPFYHRQMAQTFKAALQAEEPLGLMLYSMIDQGTDDDSRALHGPVTPMDRYEMYTRLKQMRRRLNGRCKGLLEIQPHYTDIDYLGPRVNFLHRTVRDFLLTKEMTDFLDGPTSDFKASSVIFRAHVALIKSMPVRKEHFRPSGILSRILAKAFFYAHEAEQELGYSDAGLVDELRYTVEDMADSLGADTPWERDYFIDFAVSKGLSQYLSQQTECHFGAQSIVDGSFLRAALIESIKSGSEDSPDLTGVVSLFLHRGTDPNRSSRIPNMIQETQPAKTNNPLAILWTEPERTEPYRSGMWATWLSECSAAIVEAGVNYTWAIRQKRILDLLVGHGADVKCTLARNTAWGDFVDALFHLSGHAPDNRVSAVYVGMLKKLLRHGANPNAPYGDTSVCKTFFAKACNRAGKLPRPDASIIPACDLPKAYFARQELLAQVAEALLRHGAHPSCVLSRSDITGAFTLRLSEPLCQLWEARRAETRSSNGGLLAWLWWPWSGGV